MPETKPREVNRLSKEVYDDFVKTLPPPFVTDKTTELQAGFALGVQHVLAKLREGIVIGA